MRVTLSLLGPRTTLAASGSADFRWCGHVAGAGGSERRHRNAGVGAVALHPKRADYPAARAARTGAMQPQSGRLPHPQFHRWPRWRSGSLSPMGGWHRGSTKPHPGGERCSNPKRMMHARGHALTLEASSMQLRSSIERPRHLCWRWRTASRGAAVSSDESWCLQTPKATHVRAPFVEDAHNGVNCCTCKEQ